MSTSIAPGDGAAFGTRAHGRSGAAVRSGVVRRGWGAGGAVSRALASYVPALHAHARPRAGG
ncbi:hypothetical protein D2W70_18105 [Burkholderia pseudomallei]|nr:hypothetical protein BOC49_33660 [Burkholderia pseudomallei]RIV50714.1 hypothetical protein D2W70_18105 [Burkholderia pseudomallei]RIV59126.1 hypothetical protein D2W49_21800 [Burkholderia pseudomallei]